MLGQHGRVKLEEHAVAAVDGNDRPVGPRHAHNVDLREGRGRKRTGVGEVRGWRNASEEMERRRREGEGKKVCPAVACCQRREGSGAGAER